MEFKLLFELSRWMRESTSNLSPTHSDVEGGDLEVGPIDDQVLPNIQVQDPAIDQEEESNLLGLVDENEFPEVNENESANDQTSVALSRKRKFYFYIFYCIFVILYVVLVLVTACTYPLKPEYNIDFSLPVHDKESNYTEEMKQYSVYFDITLDNRNKLTSALYDDINITMFYLPSSNTDIYFASTIIPGFYEHILKPKKLKFHMPAPGLPGLLKEDFIKMDFRVILDFTVKFHCKFLCKHKHHFLIVEEIEYSL